MFKRNRWTSVWRYIYGALWLRVDPSGSNGYIWQSFDITHPSIVPSVKTPLNHYTIIFWHPRFVSMCCGQLGGLGKRTRTHEIAGEHEAHWQKFCSRRLGVFEGDDTKQCATSLGLQVQSVVARVIFSQEKTRGLYRTLREQSKKLSSFSSSNLQNNFLVLCPQLHRVVVKHKVWM
jgi:hypothetical protein